LGSFFTKFLLALFLQSFLAFFCQVFWLIFVKFFAYFAKFFWLVFAKFFGNNFEIFGDFILPIFAISLPNFFAKKFFENFSVFLFCLFPLFFHKLSIF